VIVRERFVLALLVLTLCLLAGCTLPLPPTPPTTGLGERRIANNDESEQGWIDRSMGDGPRGITPYQEAQAWGRRGIGTPAT
jgi:hypothetical protein